MEFSDLSKQLTKSISKNDKKTQGIFFTPPETINRMIELLAPYLPEITNIMEPSCGSCEFINILNEHHPEPHFQITGIELNKKIFDAIEPHAADNVHLINTSFLTYHPDTPPELMIGNPPFFVMKKPQVDEDYYPFFDGRPNIFTLFLIKSIKILAEGGIISYVLPKNFLNCLYYDKTRQFINQTCKILEIVHCDDQYLDTEQDTIIVIFQKTTPAPGENDAFVIKKNGYTAFGRPTDITKIKSLYEGSNTTNLRALGFRVCVGNVVWNQCKTILTNDNSKTRLIYNSDIVNGELRMKTYRNEEKKNFIDREGGESPLLVVNRGYRAGTYNFEYCLIEGGFEYLIENHLICIKYVEEIEDEELTELYKKIITSLEDSRTSEFIRLYFGNNAINTTELNAVLPIYNM
jgi:type I restriction-modification system DNA methylase subunit